MWRPVDDSAIRHLWQCPHCSEDEYVGPEFYGDAGSPVCAVCDQDMGYVRTEVRDE